MRRSLSLAVLAAAALLALPRPGRAQVGYPPAHSPFRDLAKGHTVTPLVGQLFGGGGRFKIGPHDGLTYGLRYDVRVSNPLSFSFMAARAQTERFIQNPFVKLANRTSGPVDQPLTLLEAGLQFSLTGQKSWNRLAPYVGLGAGGAFSKSVPADTSRYAFGNKIYLHPRTGLRFFLTPAVHLRAEAGLPLWKLSYPTTFQQEPVEEPGTPDQPNALLPLGEKTSQWTASPWLQVGLGYTFRF
ncbi:MAG TPA: hypothetical protein VFS40_14990 [Gemmatimonadales bacterium]|nr:hypothetical protein [Gemmatimonadales bacterium]